MKRIGLLIVPVLLAACTSSSGSPTPTPGGGGGGGSSPSAGGSAPAGQSMAVGSHSVPYGIYVGLAYTGAPCGPYTNSGYFSSLNYDSVIHDVVFAPPSSSGLPGPMGAVWKSGADLQGGIAFMQVRGEGKVHSYNLCPMYETETDSYPCKVIDGPSEFVVGLSVDLPQGGEGSATLRFFATGKETGKPIMRWDGQIGTGEWGGIGGADSAYFTTTWAQLMKGEEFAFELTEPGDDGESWHWSIRFMAEGAS